MPEREALNFYDFITKDELADLPDDPHLAFCEFVRLSSDRLRDEVRRVDDNSEQGWHAISDARHGFVNVVIAVAKQFGVEPFAALTMPKFDQRKPYDYDQFKYDLDHFVAQIEIGGAIRGRRDTVDLPAASRDRIRAHLHALRECIEASKMTNAKREALLRRLDGLERELEKRRVNLLEVSLVSMAILGFPGAAWASVDIVTKLVTNIMSEVGEQKREEDETRSITSVAPTLALSPPRTEPPPEGYGSRGSARRGGYGVERPASDMDDEIPF